jgi:hypothetical protein
MPAVKPTMASGNSTRVPNTAKTMPQVRKRLRQISSMPSSTAALTTALSNESETSSTASTTTTQTRPIVAESEWLSYQP